MSLILLSIVAAMAVWLAGRRDPSRDPRLTTLALVLLAISPAFPLLPKLALLPSPAGEAGGWPWARWIALTWLGGSTVPLLRLILSAWTIHQWRHRSSKIAVVSVANRRRAELRLLPGLESPVAAGILRPVVFLPLAWQDWRKPVRDAVLAHELAHHARHDPLRRLVAAFSCAIHWFNPLVYWMARRLESQCEFASDARVLSTGLSADRYARLLCDLADTRPSPILAVAMSRRSGLEQRVVQLLGNRPSPRRWLLAGLAGFALLTAAAAALLGPRTYTIPPAEVELRLSANPFPGN